MQGPKMQEHPQSAHGLFKSISAVGIIHFSALLGMICPGSEEPLWSRRQWEAKGAERSRRGSEATMRDMRDSPYSIPPSQFTNLFNNFSTHMDQSLAWLYFVDLWPPSSSPTAALVMSKVSPQEEGESQHLRFTFHRGQCLWYLLRKPWDSRSQSPTV